MNISLVFYYHYAVCVPGTLKCTVKCRYVEIHVMIKPSQKAIAIFSNQIKVSGVTIELVLFYTGSFECHQERMVGV